MRTLDYHTKFNWKPWRETESEKLSQLLEVSQRFDALQDCDKLLDCDREILALTINGSNHEFISIHHLAIQMHGIRDCTSWPCFCSSLMNPY